MKKCLLPATSNAILAFAFTACSTGFQTERPNVIIIYTDDQGTLDLNIYGAKDLKTPHQDRLVREGVMFTQFYAQPVCSPSRASLLTGKTPQKAGVPTNVGGTAGLSTDQYTMSRMFKEAGYATANIGKWHLGEVEGKLPNDHYFDYFFGHTKGCIDNYSHFFYWRGPNEHNLFRNRERVHYPGQFFPSLMIRESARFMDKNRKVPFFLYFAINLPHYPYQGTKEWLDHYDAAGVEYPRNLYAAFLSTQDDIIGELMEMLEKRGIRENTIFVFQSDNGHSTEDRAHFGGGYTGVFRGAKACLFEGGIRVPASITWPAGISGNQIRDQFAVVSDWIPTLAELCGIQPDIDDLDGKSLMQVINDPESASPHEGHYYGWAFAGSWVIRKGSWKLHFNPRDASYPDRPYLGVDYYLVNLDEDPGEQINLADQYPDKLKELQGDYQEWRREHLIR
jgi:arylsulfatase A